MDSKSCVERLSERSCEMNVKRALIIFAVVEFIVTAFVVAQMVQK
jgi:hypothetical protein